MIRNKQATYYCGDDLTGSLLSVPEDPLRDMTEAQFWSLDGTVAVGGFPEVQIESSQANTFADTSFHVAPLMTEPLTNLFEVDKYSSLIEAARLPYSAQYVSAKNERLSTPMHLNHWTAEEESISTMTSMNVERQQSEHRRAFPSQAVSNNSASSAKFEFHGKMTPSGSPPTSSTSLSKKPKRTNEVECHRRFIFAERLRVLQELLPATLKVNQDSVQANRESVLDNAIGYIKYLELQLKGLSTSRLGGESISTPLLFLEGHGHYYPHKLFEEALEEVFGGLIEENPTAATKLLESKGLHMVPIDSIGALCRAEPGLL